MVIKRLIEFSGQFMTVIAFLTMASFSTSGQAADTEITQQPVELLESTTKTVIKILKDDSEQFKQDPDRIYKVIDEYILPHLDDVTMAKLALGKSWNQATREQKITFVNEFRNLLVRTYSKSLLEFKDQTIRYFPPVKESDNDRTSVKAEVIQPGGPSIPLAYRMRLKDNDWKVYDIQVDGVSLVTSYRGTFTQEVRKSGIDGLLKYLRDKNEQLVQKEGQKEG